MRVAPRETGEWRVDIYKHIRVYYGNMAISPACCFLYAYSRQISDGHCALLCNAAYKDDRENCCENFAG